MIILLYLRHCACGNVLLYYYTCDTVQVEMYDYIIIPATLCMWDSLKQSHGLYSSCKTAESTQIDQADKNCCSSVSWVLFSPKSKHWTCASEHGTYNTVSPFCVRGLTDVWLCVYCITDHCWCVCLCSGSRTQVNN